MCYVTMDNSNKWGSFEATSYADCRRQYKMRWPNRVLYFIKLIPKGLTIKDLPKLIR